LCYYQEVTTINAGIIKGLHANHHGGFRTFIGKIVFIVPRFMLVVTPSYILVDGKNFSWDSERPHTLGRYKIDVTSTNDDVKLLHVHCGNNLKVVIKRHTAQNVLQVDYLNVYIAEEEGLSSKADGILGNFYLFRSNNLNYCSINLVISIMLWYAVKWYMLNPQRYL